MPGARSSPTGPTAPYAGGEIVRGDGRLGAARPAAARRVGAPGPRRLAGQRGRRRARRRRGRPRRPRTPSSAWASTSRVAPCCPRWPTARRSPHRPSWATRPHAWPKLWKHHGAQRQATELTAVARGRSEPWLDRYGGVVGLEWSFPKLLEVLDEDPAVTEATEVWMEGGDWVVWQLTGAPSSGGDRTPAGLVRSTCQAGYKALWSPASGYPGAAYLEAVPPRLRPPGRAGPRRLLPGARRGGRRAVRSGRPALGLRAGVPVSAAVIDAHAGVPGAGVSETGTLVLVLGTSGCHMVMDAAEHRIPGVAGVVADGILPGSFGYETGQAAVGDAFEWARRLTERRPPWPGSRGPRDSARGRRPVRDRLVQRVPHPADGRRPVRGDPRRHAAPRAGHLYRAALEASACGLAWIVDTLRDGGVAVDRFVATGGLPQQNALFGEIVAAVLGAPVEVPRVEHGPALGAPCSALAAGGFATGGRGGRRDGRSVERRAAARIIEPAPAAIDAYREVVRRYRTAADLLAGATNRAVRSRLNHPSPEIRPDLWRRHDRD